MERTFSDIWYTSHKCRLPCSGWTAAYKYMVLRLLYLSSPWLFILKPQSDHRQQLVKPKESETSRCQNYLHRLGAWQAAMVLGFWVPTSVNQGEIICDYLSIIWNYLFFQRLFGLFVDYLSKNVPYFRQDYLRLFQIVDYLHYLRLF